MRWNQDLYWLLFTDQPLESWGVPPKNVRLSYLNASGFEDLAYRTTGVEASVLGGYKLCDWRMAYGEIFATWFRRFHFWGWVDFDVFLGRAQEWGLNFSTLENGQYDASGEHGWPSQGPLTLLRNVPPLAGRAEGRGAPPRRGHPAYERVALQPRITGCGGR